jgi:hypothetical protein
VRVKSGALKSASRGAIVGIFVSFIPFIVISVLAGAGARMIWAALPAFALSLAGVALDLRKGSVKLLNAGMAAMFGLLVAAALVPGDNAFLETWYSVLLNAGLVVIVGASMLLRRPFTLDYAKESTPPEVWTSPLFLDINWRITWVWFVVFALSTASNAVGLRVNGAKDLVFTTAIPLGLTALAIGFTRWYPEHASKAHGR